MGEVRGTRFWVRERRSCLPLYKDEIVTSTHVPPGVRRATGLEWAVSLSGGRQPHLAQ